MTITPTAWQVARIVLLLALLRATGWLVAPTQRALTGMDLGTATRMSIAVSLVSLAFVAVVLVGRRRWHPWPVLSAEAVVAGVLALVPPFQWVLWFEVGGWTQAMVGGTVQPLAIAWLGVVVLRGFHQLRGTDTPTAGTAGDPPERSAAPPRREGR